MLSLILHNRWLSLMTALFMSLISGTCYMFPSISPSLKENMQYEQFQVNLIASLGNWGSNLGILPSLVYTLVGPRPTCLLASILLGTGFFFIFFVLMQWYQTNYVMVGIFFLMSNLGNTAVYTSALSANIGNFSQKSRGVVVGCMAGCYGLSAAVFTVFYAYILDNNLIIFMLWMAILSVSITIVGCITQTVHDPAKDRNREQDVIETSQNSPSLISGEHRHGSLVNMEDESLFADISPKNMLCCLDFYLLFFMMFAGIGSNLTIINNLGSIVLSYGGRTGTHNIFVIIFSVSNCTGRLISGFLSDHLSGLISRISLMNFSLLITGLIHYAFAFSNIYMIYALVALSGIMYGCMYAMAPSFISDRFGQKYFALNFNLACVASSLGSYILSTYLAATVYKHFSREGSRYCYGRQCYQFTFLVCAGVCIVAFVLGLILMHRSRSMYQHIYTRIPQQ